MHTNTRHRSAIVTLALGAALLFGAYPAVNAQDTFFPNNAAINSTLPPSANTAVVGYPNKADWMAHSHGTSPTIKVATGASMDTCFTYNSSVVNMTGGNVGCMLTQDNSSVTMTGGVIGNAAAYDTGTLTVKSGRILGYLTGAYGGTVNVYGGIINSTGYWAGVTTGSTMNIYGGAFYGGGGAAAQIYVGIANDPIRGVVMGAATLNMYGSTIFHHSGELWWFGSSLSVASVASFTGGVEYTLAGSLSDGTNVTGLKVFVVTGSTFKIPSPGEKSRHQVL